MPSTIRHFYEFGDFRLDADYLPPAGRLGAAADRAVLHRLADAAVAGFLDRVAARLALGARFVNRFAR